MNEQNEEKIQSKSAILISSEQNEKLNLVIKIFIYYKNLINKIIIKNLNPDSAEWLQTPRFYFVNDANSKVTIKINDFEINYGFQYYSFDNDDECSIVYQSKQVENILTYLINIIQSKSSSLLHGKKVKISHF